MAQTTPTEIEIVRFFRSEISGFCTYLELLLCEIGLREVLDEEVVELLGEKSGGGMRCAYVATTLMRSSEETNLKLNALFFEFLAVHLKPRVMSEL